MEIFSTEGFYSDLGILGAFWRLDFWRMCGKNFHNLSIGVPRFCGKNFHNLPIGVNEYFRSNLANFFYRGTPHQTGYTLVRVDRDQTGTLSNI